MVDNASPFVEIRELFSCDQSIRSSLDGLGYMFGKIFQQGLINRFINICFDIGATVFLRRFVRRFLTRCSLLRFHSACLPFRFF